MLSPLVVALPTIHHCCVGAAFHLMMPPNMLSARLSVALVVTLEGVGPVADAAVNTATGDANAVPLGFSRPSDAGATNAEPPAALSNAVTRAKVKPPSVEADAMPEINTSSTSMICVVEPPLIAIHCGVVGEVIAAPAA